MEVTIGGDRLGSGNKNKIALKNYERSTHNLSQRFTSSMQCGVLYPFLVEPAMRGDTFEIDLEADGRTIPTKGPLFGSFKMQVDLFQCPWRLYQAILHNNPTAIGLKMNQVYLPQLIIPSGNGTYEQGKMSNTSLLKYLGLSGTGTKFNNEVGTNIHYRAINAIPALSYYDIFKTYYANKQEKNAYVIGSKYLQEELIAVAFQVNGSVVGAPYYSVDIDSFENVGVDVQMTFTSKYEAPYDIMNNKIMMASDDPSGDGVKFSINEAVEWCKKYLGEQDQLTVEETKSKYGNYRINIFGSQNAWASVMYAAGAGWTTPIDDSFRYLCLYPSQEIPEHTIHNQLLPFNLKNIDDMRMAILSKNNLGSAFKIGYSQYMNVDWSEQDGESRDGLPYSLLVTMDGGGELNNLHAMNGLLVKTYQSDLFNNWVNTTWIDGENGIAAVTAISTAEGSFKIDSLNLAEKLYNMLNRIAVADGTYEGWQDAVFTESPKRHIESPIYLGGMSSEIVFEEIVQTAPADGDPLGTLGGKGLVVKRKGGHVSVKVDEASFIIGIVSLTPRVNYTQGNAWYLTELQTMDDIHKPALDGIGFENLIGERMAWWDTKLDPETLTIGARSIIGKVPAWINYMTAVDKGYGDFAEPDGNGFMLLQRSYERNEHNQIKDATTYIDPRKYNYAFAYTELDAQNFWVQIQSNIKARRLMSAKQIPNI